MLSGRKRYREIQFKAGEAIIKSKNCVKYLGVVMDKNLTFGHHITYTAGKAQKAAMSLSRLMPRENGPTENKRRLLASVAESIILYAAPMWAQGCRYRKYVKKLLGVQGILAIRISRSYRTTTTEALFVLARVIPLDLMARERGETYGADPDRKRTASP
jgi:hypothetical protein